MCCTYYSFLLFIQKERTTYVNREASHSLPKARYMYTNHHRWVEKNSKAKFMCISPQIDRYLTQTTNWKKIWRNGWNRKICFNENAQISRQTSAHTFRFVSNVTKTWQRLWLPHRAKSLVIVVETKWGECVRMLSRATLHANVINCSKKFPFPDLRGWEEKKKKEQRACCAHETKRHVEVVFIFDYESLCV